MKRWESIAKIYWSDRDEPDIEVLHRRRFYWSASLDVKLASPNIGALAFLNTLHPEHRVVGVAYEVREAQGGEENR